MIPVADFESIKEKDISKPAPADEECLSAWLMLRMPREGDTRSETVSSKWVGQTIFEVTPPPICHESG